MTIRPIDYTNLISKSQEIAKIKQMENDRAQIQAQQSLIQQDKKTEQDLKRVVDTAKSENLIVDKDRRRQSNQKNDGKEQQKKQNKDEEDRMQIGSSIDIKI